MIVFSDAKVEATPKADALSWALFDVSAADALALPVAAALAVIDVSNEPVAVDAPAVAEPA